MEGQLSDFRDTHASVPDEKLVYESSNGDVWYLCEHPATGLPAIKHVANSPSGGRVSYLDVEGFLSRGHGPEHDALRDLIKRYRFSTYLIAYDFHLKEESRYQELTEAIR